MAGEKKFVFLAHWVENSNWLLWYVKDLHRHPEHAKRWFFLWPICALMSLLYLKGKRSYDVVDEFSFGNALKGETYLLRNMAWHFMLTARTKIFLFRALRLFLGSKADNIISRICESVISAQEKGADVVGLGALVKAEGLTAGGQKIIQRLGERLRIPVVHGDTLTAATVIRQVNRLIERFKIDSPVVFLTGATSKIGRATAITLAKARITVKMYTGSEKRFQRIQKEAGDSAIYLEWAESLQDGQDCKIWITGKATPANQRLLRYIPKGAVVLNFSVPNPLSSRVIRSLTDIYAVEGGLLAYDPKITNLAFTMRLWPGVTYACHAGTMVHAYKGWTHNEVSHIDLDQLDVVWEASEELGFFLPPLPGR